MLWYLRLAAKAVISPWTFGGGSLVVSVSFVGSSLSFFFFFFTVDVCCVCVCVFISSECAFVTGLSLLWKVRLGMHAHKNKLTLTMCPLYLTWFVSIHTHGPHSSGNPLLPPPPPPLTSLPPLFPPSGSCT